MRTSRYYDGQALNEPRKEAWGKRRKEHNIVKYLLLKYALHKKQCHRIVDLACGKGGDLNKYETLCPLARLTAVDASANSLDVFRKRATGCNVTIDDVIHQDAALARLQSATYDLAVVNFALHYFCDTETHLNQLLANISGCLVPGGLFMGTCIDYRMLKHENNNIDAAPGILLAINAKPWGRSYRYKLQGCVDADEYVVYFPRIVSIAHSLNMHLVKIQSFNGFLFANGEMPQTPQDNSPYMVFVFVHS